jgi:hypothetical protein
MRFGLHSGPVIAGVLRGDKGRFQLFGDVRGGTHAFRLLCLNHVLKTLTVALFALDL